MKVFLAAIALAGALAVPASAYTPQHCVPPDVHVHGFGVSSLTETAIGCHNAREAGARYLRNSLHGYSCTSRLSGGQGRIVHLHCVQIAHHEYAFSMRYYVQ